MRYFIFRYENDYYPGVVQEIEKEEVLVSAMTKSGFKNYKWPKPQDVCWYNFDKIIKKIKVPRCVSIKKGLYNVPEMKIYEKYSD